MAEEKAAKKVRLQGDLPPVFQSLEDFSQESRQNKQRYSYLVAKFEERHGRKPDFLARAPGRVNIIGEHIDYSGYAVLPMAIEQDVAMACGRNDTQVLRLSNCSELYDQYTKSIREGSPTIQGHDWFNYFLCGYKGVVDDLGAQDAVGMDVVVDGNIPPSAGLSSSSALVCCAALATAHANGIDMPSKQEFAELCAKSERYIGTEGGGMDQAISFLGERNKAMLIEFNPIHPTDVCLPSGTIFVISNTCVLSNKVAFASYNERVVECRLASMVVAKTKGLDWKNVRKLLQLQSALGLKLNEMHEVVCSCLHREVYSREEVCTLLDISEKGLESDYLNNMTKGMQSFELYKRAAHVFAEAERVFKFKDTANTPDAVTDTASTSDTVTDTANMPADTGDTATKLGRLMDESHTSCSQLYECSCPELDQLIHLCKSNGALGSRLTGAGWGGCAVSLVRSEDLEKFLKGVGEDYYKDKDSDVLSNSLFASFPGPGAALCNFSG